MKRAELNAEKVSSVCTGGSYTQLVTSIIETHDVQ